MLARDLVTEPANVLGPAEFAERAKGLTKLGVEVEVSGRSSCRSSAWARCSASRRAACKPRVVVMQWNGAGAKTAPSPSSARA